MKLIWRTLQDVLPLLPAKARRFLGFYVVATSALALLDIAALGLLAITLAAMVDTDGSGIPLPLVGEIQRDSVVWVLAAISLLGAAISVLRPKHVHVEIDDVILQEAA